MPAVSFSRWFQCSGSVKSVNATAWSTLDKTRDYPSLSLIAPDTVFLISSRSVDQFPKCWLPNSFKSVLIKWAQKKEQYPMEWPVKPYTTPALNDYLKDWKCKNLGFHHSPIWLWKSWVLTQEVTIPTDSHFSHWHTISDIVVAHWCPLLHSCRNLLTRWGLWEVTGQEGSCSVTVLLLTKRACGRGSFSFSSFAVWGHCFSMGECNIKHHLGSKQQPSSDTWTCGYLEFPGSRRMRDKFPYRLFSLRYSAISIITC